MPPTIMDRFRQLRPGRRRHEPTRETASYPKLRNYGAMGGIVRDRPLIKPTPSNLRKFSKTVYARRAINSIKDPIAMEGWELRPKKDVKPNSEINRQIELLTACFQKPNRDDGWRSMVEQLVEDALVCGQMTMEHHEGGDPIRPLFMWPVDALSIQIFGGWDGNPDRPRYWQSLGYGNVGATQGIAIRDDELMFARVNPTTDNPFGLGPLEVAFASINRQLGVQDYAGNVAANAVPSKMLYFQGATEEQIQTIRSFWQNEIEGQGKSPIFGGDGEAEAVDLRGTKDEDLFLKYQELLVREIAAAFGVSPQNLSIERDVNRDTAEVSEDRDWRQTIIPMANLLTTSISRDVIEGRFGFSQIELVIPGLDREDEVATTKVLEGRWKMNSLTVDEIRARYGEEPMGGEATNWGSMTKADIDIAVSAAKGAKEVDDPKLHQESTTPSGGRGKKITRKK